MDWAHRQTCHGLRAPRGSRFVETGYGAEVLCPIDVGERVGRLGQLEPGAHHS